MGVPSHHGNNGFIARYPIFASLTSKTCFMEQQKPTTGKFSLQFGVLAGLAGTAFSIMLYTMGMAYEQSPAQSGISIAILFGVIFYGIYTFKGQNEGYLTLKEALKIGSGAGLVAALVSVVYLLVLTNVIDPTFWDKAFELGREQMIEQNPSMSDEQLDQIVAMQKNFAWVTYPTLLVMNTIMGLIIGLVSGLILKKNRD